MNFSELSKELNEELSKLEGQGGLSVEFIDTKEVFEFNSDDKFWIASVVKIIIALATFNKLNNEGISEQERVKITEENYVLGSGVLKLLDKENNYTYKDLATLMITVSDNTAANQLIDYVGIDNIENYIKEIGLSSTTFKHKMMIKAGEGPNLTTPSDMTVLLKMMFNNEITGAREVLDIMNEQIDRTLIPLYIPNDIKISHKYGSLPKAIHEVGIVYSKNPFIFSFFSDDQKDKKLTKEVLSKCAKLCFDYSMEA